MRSITPFIPVVALLAFEASAVSSVRVYRTDGSPSLTPRYDVAPPPYVQPAAVQRPQAPARPILLNANATPSRSSHPRTTAPIVPVQQQALPAPVTQEVSPAPAPTAQPTSRSPRVVPLAPKPVIEQPVAQPVAPRVVERPIVQSRPTTYNVRVADYTPRKRSTARVFRLRPLVIAPPPPQAEPTVGKTFPVLKSNETAKGIRPETVAGRSTPTIHRAALPIAEKPVMPTPPQPGNVVAVQPQPAPAVQKAPAPVYSQRPARPVVITAPRQGQAVPAPKPPVPVARQVAPAPRDIAPVAQPVAAPVATPTPRRVARQAAPAPRVATPVGQPAVAPQPTSKRPRRRLPIAPVNDTTNLPPVPAQLLAPTR